VCLVDRGQQFEIGCCVIALETGPKRDLGAIQPNLDMAANQAR
jgi:hypothetical protein